MGMNKTSLIIFANVILGVLGYIIRNAYIFFTRGLFGNSETGLTDKLIGYVLLFGYVVLCFTANYLIVQKADSYTRLAAIGLASILSLFVILLSIF